MRDPLIKAVRVPVAHKRVRVSVLYPLDPAFGSAVDMEVIHDLRHAFASTAVASGQGLPMIDKLLGHTQV